MKDTKLSGGRFRRFILQAAAALLIAASIQPAQISCAAPGSGDQGSMILYASSEKKKDTSKDTASEKKKDTSKDTASEKKKEPSKDTASEKKKDTSKDTSSEKKEDSSKDASSEKKKDTSKDTASEKKKDTSKDAAADKKSTEAAPAEKEAEKAGKTETAEAAATTAAAVPAETAETAEAAAPARTKTESATGQATDQTAEPSAGETASGDPEKETEAEPAAESGENSEPEEAGASGTQTEPAAEGEEKEAGKDGGAAESQVHTVTELELGRQYLRYLDERTAAEMQVRVDEARAAFQLEKKKKAYAVERDAYHKKLSGDKVWSSFKDYVFLGDSRVVGFDVYGFLDSDRILADAGDTILAIDDRVEAMEELSPRYIFISYGINDVNLGLWPTAQEYARDFGARIDELRKSFPEAEIYVNSILPATDDAIEQHPLWENLPEYSEAVRQMCEQKEICFIDNTSIVEDHKDLYAMDGVHIAPDFYHYWAENQLLGVYDLKHGFLSF
ncbi:GDSL-like Lipase/Acylhydrolase family [Sarcina sp. DSM 11001]|uniref:SGNH/GDSL hydrolase family protein n=1 Tax=Sarcina sp. DSM 11001 TaxID=1798184 RepID=UPI0008814EE4|nr:GDSL-type esterase/lipase family protein [Sarcina sp. DSM 11001]SDL50906.1 GDSL-like Lipase/Acylhydrolase family [Sarcina sp. DSM 11001]